MPKVPEAACNREGGGEWGQGGEGRRWVLVFRLFFVGSGGFAFSWGASLECEKVDRAVVQ